jgi:SagB-type dehydrogenase family enzyme
MSNSETDRLFAYHERTKHSYASVYHSGWSLDWDNQPDPFRRYVGAPRVELPPPEDGPRPQAPTSTCLLGLGDGAEGAAAAQPWPERALPLLGSLLFHSMAISAWKQVPDSTFRYSLRVNPSSGNLHPTETWIAAAGCADLPDGLYHYDVRGHALERCRDGPALAALDALVGLLPSRGLCAVLTSIFWREAWKYRDRAYRYCLHDAGHAAGSIATAARGLGLACRIHGHFADRALERLMDLDGTDERPLMILDLRPEGPAGTQPGGELEALAAALGPRAGTPNRLSAEERPYSLIDGMHLSTQIEGGPCPAGPERPAPPEDGLPLPDSLPGLEPLHRSVRRRRSALDYDPAGRTTLPAFAGILRESASLPRCDFLGTLRGGAPQRLVELYAYVHRVEGLEPGCYRYLHARDALQLVRAGDVRGVAAGLSLGQELAGHAIAAFSLIADLGPGAAAFGNRAYRYAHFEAGLVGQGLYLAATARDLDATGIGAFFDDDVHRWLGLVGRERQVIYHHSIGKAVIDPRLLGGDQETPDVR